MVLNNTRSRDCFFSYTLCINLFSKANQIQKSIHENYKFLFKAKPNQKPIHNLIAVYGHSLGAFLTTPDIME